MINRPNSPNAGIPSGRHKQLKLLQAMLDVSYTAGSGSGVINQHGREEVLIKTPQKNSIVRCVHPVTMFQSNFQSNICFLKLMDKTKVIQIMKLIYKLLLYTLSSHNLLTRLWEDSAVACLISVLQGSGQIRVRTFVSFPYSWIHLHLGGRTGSLDLFIGWHAKTSLMTAVHSEPSIKHVYGNWH